MDRSTILIGWVKRVPIEPYLRRALRVVNHDDIEAALAEGKLRVRGEEPLGKLRQSLLLAGVDALFACAVCVRAARLDLHEGERIALLRDDVQLAFADAPVAREQHITMRLQEPRRLRLARAPQTSRDSFAPHAEVEQHQQQVGVIHHAVPVQVYRRVIRAEGEQHLQQVRVVDHIVAVHIAWR
jgi:hypothetical protein